MLLVKRVIVFSQQNVVCDWRRHPFGRVRDPGAPYFPVGVFDSDTRSHNTLEKQACMGVHFLYVT